MCRFVQGAEMVPELQQYTSLNLKQKIFFGTALNTANCPRWLCADAICWATATSPSAAILPHSRSAV